VFFVACRVLDFFLAVETTEDTIFILNSWFCAKGDCGSLAQKQQNKFVAYIITGLGAVGIVCFGDA